MPRAVAIESSSLAPRSIGKAPSELMNQVCSRFFWNSSFLATKYSGRFDDPEIANGSRNERWLAAKITGPSVGTCSLPIRSCRNQIRKNGRKKKRTSR